MARTQRNDAKYIHSCNALTVIVMCWQSLPQLSQLRRQIDAAAARSGGFSHDHNSCDSAHDSIEGPVPQPSTHPNNDTVLLQTHSRPSALASPSTHTPKELAPSFKFSDDDINIICRSFKINCRCRAGEKNQIDARQSSNDEKT